MIQANELRVGNWVTVRLIGIEIEGTPQQINANNLVDIAEEKGAFLNKKCYDPIPLTPEILEKCGFEQDIQDGMDTYSIPINEDGSYLDWHDDGSVLFRNGDNMVDCAGRVNHLHQLQNLYFALTGEELTIRL